MAAATERKRLSRKFDERISSRARQVVTAHSESLHCEDYVRMDSPYTTHPGSRKVSSLIGRSPLEKVLRCSQMARALMIDNAMVIRTAIFGGRHQHTSVGWGGEKEARAERGVFLHWVKAHFGYHGNELVDGETKVAADYPPVSHKLAISSSRLKTNLRFITVQAWQDRWDYTPNKGRYTLSLIPKVSLKHRFWGEITELLTGHGRFPAHFHRFGIEYDDLCACGAVGDAKNYLVSCPLTGPVAESPRRCVVRRRFWTVSADYFVIKFVMCS
ncbi:hypothetical protein AVEN_197438-1 [Araneus ventricosus]|uniref:RNase H type-1 domain-containing protein n=1 Tax=Araneus ventricosus TaxID=182803 RepID=A0A4Y2IDE1_ARAVE|nr:hypothetical protein AVEN_197438-1 [Araneus ventricosus]